VYKQKVDGWRILAHKDGDHVRLVSRHGVDHTKRCRGAASRRASWHERAGVRENGGSVNWAFVVPMFSSTWAGT
jgi:hypothetical protein